MSKSSTNNKRNSKMAIAMGLMKEMSGVLGNVVIVHRGKKVFIKNRPKKSKNPPTELSLAKWDFAERLIRGEDFWLTGISIQNRG